MVEVIEAGPEVLAIVAEVVEVIEVIEVIEPVKKREVSVLSSCDNV